MPDEPYRYAQPRQDDVLARLARQGQMRIDSVQHIAAGRCQQ